MSEFVFVLGVLMWALSMAVICLILLTLVRIEEFRHDKQREKIVKIVQEILQDGQNNS